MGTIEERKTTVLIGQRAPNLKPHEAVQSIGFVFDQTSVVTVRGMFLNGNTYGRGTKATEILHLAEDEHINFLKADNRNIDLRTNLGRQIILGDSLTDPLALSDVEVVGISPGRDDGTFALSALTVSNTTTEGEPFVEEEGVFALIDIVPQFMKITTAQSTETRRLSAASKIVAKQFGTAASATAKTKVKVGGLFAKASFSASISASSTRSFTDVTEISEEVALKEATGTTTVTEVPEGYVGLQLVQVSLIREADGFEWLYPTAAPEFVILKIDDALLNQEFYDLTGVAGAQLPNLDSARLDPGKPFDWYDLPQGQSSRSALVYDMELLLGSGDQDRAAVFLGGAVGVLLLAIVMLLVFKVKKVNNH